MGGGGARRGQKGGYKAVKFCLHPWKHFVTT